MLHQHALRTAAGIPLAGMPGRELRTLRELLASARASVESDPDRVLMCLDRIAGMFQTPDEEATFESLLLPQAHPLRLAGAPRKGGLAPWQLRRALTFIHEHLSGPVPVEALARVTRLSSGHFCRAFKASVGETPHNFLTRQRVRHAQRLMLTTDDTLSQIACACGLTDQAHLTRLFRKLIGETPLAWRRACRNG
ncbi:helix-turn-helix domain-containing protein [Sphingosinithalassobacter portus]|uniref:helix-turn-helix domain-containing protein n=1 Tax=Stakelama portus TaxID=2676234 RepID=UPI001EFD5C6A|nr:AraC family transcriptional regulator [Sphingosinithalassobacter portus]